MKLRLIHDKSKAGAPVGKLYVNGLEFCDTVTDESQEIDHGWANLYGTTPLPSGRYAVTIERADCVGAELPKILGVPGHGKCCIRSDAVVCPGACSGVRVGRHDGGHRLADSGGVFARILALIGDAFVRSEPIELEIE